jgi:hypothetical protein
LMCFCKDILIFYCLFFSLHCPPNLSLPFSLLPDWLQATALLCIYLYIVYTNRKKSTTYSERERERKRREETINYTITEKKEKKRQEEDASHVSKQHDGDNFYWLQWYIHK